MCAGLKTKLGVLALFLIMALASASIKEKLLKLGDAGIAGSSVAEDGQKLVNDFKRRFGDNDPVAEIGQGL